MNAELINNLIANADNAIAEAQGLLLIIQETELPNQDELYNENLMDVATDDAEENIVQEFMRISKTLTDAMLGDMEEFFMPTATELPPALLMIEHIEQVLERPSVKKIVKRLENKVEGVVRPTPMTAEEKIGAPGCKECPRCPYWYKGEKGLRDHMERDICSRVAVGQVLRPAETTNVKVDNKIYWATKKLEPLIPRSNLFKQNLDRELSDDEYEEIVEETNIVANVVADVVADVVRCEVCDGKMNGLDGSSDDCYCDYCFDCGERLEEGEYYKNGEEDVCKDCYLEEDDCA
jgi:hypothetical protein